MYRGEGGFYGLLMQGAGSREQGTPVASLPGQAGNREQGAGKREQGRGNRKL